MYQHNSNKCKAAWKVINNIIKANSSFNKSNIAPDEFNNLFKNSIKKLQQNSGLFMKNKSTFHAIDGLVRDVLRTFEFEGLAQTPLIQAFFLFPILFIPILVIKKKFMYMGTGHGFKYGIPQGSVFGP